VALDDVSLRLKRGTVHALIGETRRQVDPYEDHRGIYTPDAGELCLCGAARCT